MTHRNEHHVSVDLISLVQASPKAAISAALPSAICTLLRASGRKYATTAVAAANAGAQARLSATTAAPILAASARVRAHAAEQTALAGSVIAVDAARAAAHTEEPDVKVVVVVCLEVVVVVVV